MKKYQHWIIYRFYRTISSLAKVHGKRESATMGEDYHRVAALLRKVDRKRGSYLSADDLESLGIKLSGMDIETGRPAGSGPQFCDPYPSPEFDKLFEKVSADLRLGDEENVYYAGHGMGMLIEECLSDLDVFDCWDPSDRITTYRVR
jgi:hypothetical protein